MSSRVSAALVILLGVVVVSGTALMWIDYREGIDEAVAETASDPAATSTSTPTSTPEETPLPTPDETPAQPRSLWIGDGYTSQACSAAEILDWRCVVDAQRGTGFLSDGSSFDASYETLPGRLDDLPRKTPDVVVIDAGRNDLGVYATAALLETMDTYLADLRSEYPDADIVQIVPWSLDQSAPDPALTQAVEEQATEHDVLVIDPVGEGWAGAGRTDLPEQRDEQGALNEAGREAVSQGLAGSLAALQLS